VTVQTGQKMNPGVVRGHLVFLGDDTYRGKKGKKPTSVGIVRNKEYGHQQSMKKKKENRKETPPMIKEK